MRKQGLSLFIHRHGLLIFGILCLFVMCMAAGARPRRHHPNARAAGRDSLVYLLHADRLHYDQYSRPGVQIVNGHVAFRHAGAYLYCDSAYFFPQTNSFQAFGNVRMFQGDTLSLRSRRLYYEGSEMLAEAREDVVLKHRRSILRTDSLNYDRVYDIGYFFKGGRLYDQQNVLHSQWGQYSPSTREAIFNHHVVLTNPKFKIHTDSLHYNTRTALAHIVGPSRVTSKDADIITSLGYYNTRTDRASLFSRSTVLNKDGKTLTGDSLYYDKKRSVGRAYGNAEYTDPKNKHKMNADYCYYNDKTGYAFGTKRALVRDYSQNAKDTIFLHADTLKLYTFNQKTDSVYRRIHAFHKARMFRTDVQAVSDSMVYITRDSCLTLYYNPIVWQKNQQLVGEQINVYLKDSTINWAHVIGQAMSIEQMDSVHYNQCSSKEMKAFFLDGKPRHVQAIDNVRTVYYPLDNDSTLMALNYMECALLNMYMNKGQLQKIVASPQVTGTWYPLALIPPDKMRLPQFAWFDYIRPKDKYDVFEWRAKKAGTELKKEVKRQAPVQNLDILSGKQPAAAPEAAPAAENSGSAAPTAAGSAQGGGEAATEKAAATPQAGQPATPVKVPRRTDAKSKK